MIAALALAAAAALAQSPDRNEKYYFEDIHRPYFLVDGGRAVPQRPGSYAKPFPVPKPEGETRVFIVGGSVASAYGGKLDLEEALRRALPGRATRVVNVGMAGYDSHRELLVAEEIAGYQPDVVVFVSGHNDFSVNASPPAAAWRRRLAARLASSPAGDWLADLAGRHGSPRWRAGRLRALESNLRAGVRRARAAGALVVVVVPPLNYRDTPPDRPLPWLCPDFVAGWLAALEGRADAAAAAWTKARAHEPEHAHCASWAAFYLGRIAEAAGRSQDAAALIAESMDRSSGDFCTRSCQQTLRRVARQEGAALADADAAYLAADAPRLPGLDRFYGTFHWTEDSHWPVSSAILAALRERRPSWNWAAGAVSAMDREAAAARRRRPVEAACRKKLYLAMTRMSLARDGFSGRAAAWLSALREDRPDWFSNAARFDALARRLFETEGRAMAASNAAFTLSSPAFPAAALSLHLGHVRLRAGDASGAAKDFDAALEAGAGGQALLARAAAQHRLGRRARASADLDAAAAAGLAAEAAVLRSSMEALR